MNDTALALYRKYRPETFAEVRNQEHIVTVLEGALQKGIIPHALLFTGSRGTGKTTVARIFARAVGATAIDTIEIDAASNRGIDDIRALKDAVQALPFESPYKVYIIDEVHMLSKDAFNALLKTLEEPPRHVVFILATTERDKVLDTIVSRCQVFTFHAPTRDQLRDVVISVAKKEKMQLDAGVAEIIALCADGSYRDVLGITQKVIMASHDAVLSADEVALIVGAPKSVLLERLIDALATKNIQEGLHALEEADTAHVDQKIFMKLLIERVRAIMLVRHRGDAITSLYAHYTDSEQKKIRMYAENKECGINSHLLLKLIDAYEYTQKSPVRLLAVEVLLMEHCS
jgi:DNA polymerase III subunit gamma/tau